MAGNLVSLLRFLDGLTERPPLAELRAAVDGMAP